MFSTVHLRNFGAFSDFTWSGLGQVNVVVGENDTGKSHLLKAMYVMAKCVEARRKPEASETSWPQTALDKMRWTFQPRGIGTLVRHGASKAHIEADLLNDHRSIRINPPSRRPRRSPLKWVVSGTEGAKSNEDVSVVFIPPKEVLTTFSAIAATRETLEIFGFDDTYYDLIKQLRLPATQGEIDPRLSKVLEELRELFEGKIVKSQSSDEFSFERGKRAYSMPQTADGIKKIGILATLIENRSLNLSSIVFLDEPETNLHPKAITYLTRMLFEIGRAGAQVFVATHSYLVIKQLQILAKMHGENLPFCSLVRENGDVVGQFSDLREGMPANPIIEESIRLYREELALELSTNEGS